MAVSIDQRVMVMTWRRGGDRLGSRAAATRPEVGHLHVRDDEVDPPLCPHPLHTAAAARANLDRVASSSEPPRAGTSLIAVSVPSTTRSSAVPPFAASGSACSETAVSRVSAMHGERQLILADRSHFRQSGSGEGRAFSLPSGNRANRPGISSAARGRRFASIPPSVGPFDDPVA